MKAIFLIFLTGILFFSQAQPIVGFSTFIGSGLTKPIDIVNAKDGTNRLFFVQQNGAIRVYSGGVLQATPFLDVSSLITFDNNGERGLLSMAFHPNYATNGYFFIYYNNSAGNVTLAQYHVSLGNANVADASSGRVLLTITKPFTNHNGAKLLFGPDGNLYFGTGDGGSGGDPNNNAQNGNSLLGKMLRINVDNFTTAPYYTVPATNPFVGVTGYLPEIYATGLRNPWRWSFDRANNNMWIADVGQGAWEEVNSLTLAQTSGANYGWRCYEGTHAFDLSQCGTTPAAGKTAPIFEYPHSSSGGYSITGGFVYRGTEFPSLQGYYICCDYVTTNGWLINSNISGSFASYQQTNFPANIVTFGEAEDGTLYAASLNGPIYKVIVSGALPVKLLSFSGRQQNNQDVISWSATVDASLSRFEIERSTDGTRFSVAGSQLPNVTGNVAQYQLSVINSTNEIRYYRLKMIYKDGSASYSAIVKLDGKNNQQLRVNYSGSQLQLYAPTQLRNVSIYNAAGQKLADYKNMQIGNHSLSLGNLSSGVYLINFTMENGEQRQVKFFVP